MSYSLPPHGLYSPWNSPGQNTGVGSLSLLPGIFPTHSEIEPRSPALQADSLPSEPPGKPNWRKIYFSRGLRDMSCLSFLVKLIMSIANLELNICKNGQLPLAMKRNCLPTKHRLSMSANLENSSPHNWKRSIFIIEKQYQRMFKLLYCCCCCC